MEERWQASDRGWIKINFDATLHGESSVTAVGGVARENESIYSKDWNAFDA